VCELFSVWLSPTPFVLLLVFVQIYGLGLRVSFRVYSFALGLLLGLMFRE